MNKQNPVTEPPDQTSPFPGPFSHSQELDDHTGCGSVLPLDRTILLGAEIPRMHSTCCVLLSLCEVQVGSREASQGGSSIQATSWPWLCLEQRYLWSEQGLSSWVSPPCCLWLSLVQAQRPGGLACPCHVESAPPSQVLRQRRASPPLLCGEPRKKNG